jgi:hypothetical protein
MEEYIDRGYFLSCEEAYNEMMGLCIIDIKKKCDKCLKCVFKEVI